MTEEALDVRRVMRTLSQRWLVILAVVVAGAASGLGAGVFQSPTYKAKAQVLLPPSGVDALGNPQRNIKTEQEIASSGEVLSRAGQALKPPVGVTALRHRVKVGAPTPDIIEVQALAGSGQDAALLANSVATAYVEFSNDSTVQVATTTLSDLQAEATALDDHIRQVNSDIADNTARLAALNVQSPEGQRQSAIIDSLRQDLTDTARELSSVNTKIADARLSADLMRRGTRLLQPAAVPGNPASPHPMLYALMGGLAGLLIAIVAVLIRGRDRRRLRRRDDLAVAAGAPVLVSLAAPRRHGVDDYRALLERWEPSLAERWSILQTFTQLGLDDQPTTMAFVTLAGDVTGPGLALLVAKLAAVVGTTTALSVETRHPDATSLRGACNLSNGAGSPVPPELSLHTAAPTSSGQDPFPGTQLTVTLVVADGGPVQLPAPGQRTITVLGVSSGFATADQVAATALRCFDAGHAIAGVVVANPDPADTTTGRTHAGPTARATGDVAVDPFQQSSNGTTSMPRPVS